MRKQTEKPKYWSMGKVLPGGYVVVDHLGQGGMGTVYLVEKQVSLKTHSYAVKTMIPEIADNTGRRRDFLRELRTWIDLPTHPNLVACRFFRTIDNTLAVFAEYVQGSSLNRWIVNNSNAPVETLLDIAIQIAWGLECAHVAGVIHQDVKPSNILIAENNTAKVTDFGLARSRYTGTAPLNTTDTGETLLISSRGMTMPYCSLEQAMGRKISRRTDMWSFGLTVLEMFNGGLTWRLGSEAIQILEYHLQEGPLRPMPEMPGELIKILRGCFEEDPQKRWESMSMVADRLIALYEQVTGRCYFRSVPIPDSMDIVEEAQDRHTSDGGWWVDPVKFYQETQELLDVGEPFNVEELQEPPQSSQRARALHDIELFELAEELLQASIAVGSGEESWCVKLANSHFNKALAIESCQDMRNAAETYQQAIDVLSGIKSRIAIELAARSYMNQSGCLLLCGDQERSLETINQAIERYRQLMDDHPDPREIRMFVNSLMNKAVVLNQMMQMKESLEYLEKAMSHCEHLLELDNTNSNWNMLGFIQVNLVMLRYHLGEMDRALDMAIQSMDIFQYLFDQSNTYDSASVLGVLYHKKAQIYRKNKQPVRCRENIIQGIDFLQSQLRQAGREDLRVHLAELFGFQAEQYLINGDLDDARQTITNARELLETVVVEEDQAHHKLTLARISLSETIIYFAGADRSLGQKYGVMAVGFWVQLVDSNELDISSMRREMNAYVSNFLDDFQLFETDKSIVEIFKKIVRTMFSKFPEADPETWPVFQLLR